jgi:hypothetical protein
MVLLEVSMTYKEKLIRNEQLIRDKNEAITDAIKKYFSGTKGLSTSVLQFTCECSDLDCDAVVTLSIKEYEQIHKQNNRFVLAPGHESPSVEKVVKTNEDLKIVEKPELAR